MLRKIIPACLVVVILVSGFFILSPHAVRAQDLTPEARAALQAQYDELQKEIAVQQQIIKDTQAKKNTLQGDVTLLNAQIKAAQAQIDAKNIVIKQLAAQIVQKNAVIVQLSGRIEKGKEGLASILRQEEMIDNTSIVTVLLSNDNVSAFFSDLDAFVSIKNDLKNLFVDIRNAKAQTETEKAALAEKQNQTVDAKYEVVSQQQKIANDKSEKQQLLTITANQEAQYKKVLADRQAKAAAIRAALFPLRDASAISFGVALQYAQQAQKVTGVNPALALAILTQESNLGTNVGQCYLTDDATGAGVGKTSGKVFAKVMSPKRDVPVFIKLGQLLGFDPHHQVVSCPIASAGGWGGAMGPAQFIPSTWDLYSDRVAQGAGESLANPWDPKDAIMAMSFLLADNGASAGGYTAEYNAAARYYAGWGGPNTTAGRGYAQSVMNTIKNTIQPNIDFLSNI